MRFQAAGQNVKFYCLTKITEKTTRRELPPGNSELEAKKSTRTSDHKALHENYGKLKTHK